MENVDKKQVAGRTVSYYNEQNKSLKVKKWAWKGSECEIFSLPAGNEFIKWINVYK